jgi:hypothetical protein
MNEGLFDRNIDKLRLNMRLCSAFEIFILRMFFENVSVKCQWRESVSWSRVIYVYNIYYDKLQTLDKIMAKRKRTKGQTTIYKRVFSSSKIYNS